MKYCVTINNKRYEVEVEKGEAAIVSTTESTPVELENKDTAYIQTAATTTLAKTTKSPEQAAENAVAGKEVVKAPMAGVVTDIKVSVGSAVKIGDTLLLLEAMKMENEITAHVDGIVVDIRITKGAVVSAADVLAVIK